MKRCKPGRGEETTSRDPFAAAFSLGAFIAMPSHTCYAWPVSWPDSHSFACPPGPRQGSVYPFCGAAMGKMESPRTAAGRTGKKAKEERGNEAACQRTIAYGKLGHARATVVAQLAAAGLFYP